MPTVFPQVSQQILARSEAIVSKYTFIQYHLTAGLPIANRTTLRILPLGDSITFGFKSTTGNGYRRNLQVLLLNNTVEYIGSVTSGHMVDNHHEGHNGAIINQIAQFAKRSLGERPNVVLLMAGTNDMVKNVHPHHAPHRLGNLIDEVTEACPDAVVLVAQLIQNAHEENQRRIEQYNKHVLEVVEERAADNRHVMSVDMSVVKPRYLSDGLHPNDKGYQIIADVWYAGLVKASDKGWITPAVNVTHSVESECCCLHLLGPYDTIVRVLIESSDIKSPRASQVIPGWPSKKYIRLLQFIPLALVRNDLEMPYATFAMIL
ncbi:MAG: hypothetical protein M1834_000706 [Cirrosporium novae-zelandiae]|nr:MAG: hypothetical protein M1834_000706 [Cirrosporium novae-zelandiae]